MAEGGCVDVELTEDDIPGASPLEQHNNQALRYWQKKAELVER